MENKICVYVYATHYFKDEFGGWAVVITKNDKLVTKLSDSTSRVPLISIEYLAITEALKAVYEIFTRKSLRKSSLTLRTYYVGCSKDRVRDFARRLRKSKNLRSVNSHWDDSYIFDSDEFGRMCKSSAMEVANEFRQVEEDKC